MGTCAHGSYFCLQTILFFCGGFHHPVNNTVPESPAVSMHTAAAWKAVSRGAEGRQPETKYLLQQSEQGCLQGGGAMCVQGREKELTPTVPLAAMCQEHKCVELLIYSPQNCYKLNVIIIPIYIHLFLHLINIYDCIRSAVRKPSLRGGKTCWRAQS